MIREARGPILNQLSFQKVDFQQCDKLNSAHLGLRLRLEVDSSGEDITLSWLAFDEFSLVGY